MCSIKVWNKSCHQYIQTYTCKYRYGYENVYIYPFVEPNLMLKFDRKPIAHDMAPHHAISVNITCSLSASSGKPQIQIGYIGSHGSPKSESEVISERTDLVDHGYYFQVTKHTTMHLPTKGHIICSVTDDRGHYLTSEPVVTTGKLFHWLLSLGGNGSVDNNEVYLVEWKISR